MDNPHVHLFLFTCVAVCLGLLFVKQKGVADAADNAADLPSTYQVGGAVLELVGLHRPSLMGDGTTESSHSSCKLLGARGCVKRLKRRVRTIR